jgi:hypothetical protein
MYTRVVIRLWQNQAKMAFLKQFSRNKKYLAILSFAIFKKIASILARSQQNIQKFLDFQNLNDKFWLFSCLRICPF